MCNSDGSALPLWIRQTLGATLIWKVMCKWLFCCILTYKISFIFIQSRFYSSDPFVSDILTLDWDYLKDSFLPNWVGISEFILFLLHLREIKPAFFSVTGQKDWSVVINFLLYVITDPQDEKRKVYSQFDWYQSLSNLINFFVHWKHFLTSK